MNDRPGFWIIILTAEGRTDGVERPSGNIFAGDNPDQPGTTQKYLHAMAPQQAVLMASP